MRNARGVFERSTYQYNSIFSVREKMRERRKPRKGDIGSISTWDYI
jgi:hypothetical protein